MSQSLNSHANNQGQVTTSNNSSGAPQRNIVQHQKHIKSNNQVFQQNQHVRIQSGQPSKQGYSQQQFQHSPTKVPKKIHNQNSNQNFEYQHSKFQGGQVNQESANRLQTGHRRSKTDGNAQNIVIQQVIPQNGKNFNQQHQKYNQENVLNLNLQHQLDKNKSQSRQQNINSNLNLGQKNSNQSAKSAQIQGMNTGKINSMISVDQTRNLSNINQDSKIGAVTRNTNLQSQQKKDQQQFSNQQMVQGQHNSYSYTVQDGSKKNLQKGIINVNTKQSKNGQSQMIPQLANGNPNNISIDQLQQLMKNPQIAQFLKEQIELQQQTDGSQPMQFQGISRTMAQQKVGAAGHNSHVTQNSLNHNENQLLMQAVSGIPQPLRCSESNMNSDTSQEILRYQSEWAKQFHEHVNGMQALHALQNQSSSTNQEEKGVISGQGVPSQMNPSGNSMLTGGGDSSQMILNRPDDSQEQIALLPESAFTNVGMQNLNNNVSKDRAQAINFYQQNQQNRLETEISTGNTNQTSALVYDKKGGRHDQGNYGSSQVAPAPARKVPEKPQGSRNIMNGGKQLSFMTICSDVLDDSADLDLEYLEDDSQKSAKDEEDEYLTFQLCEGEEMNNEMANFIGIHMLNDGYLDGEEPNPQDKEQEGGLTYQCPETGSHFEFMDLVGRMRNLKSKRVIIDQAIQAEDQRMATIRKQKQQQEQAKQKQLQKQRKLKTQVQNILKSAQQDNSDQDNDSLPRQSNVLQTESDLLILEDEDHLQSHHITTNVKNSNINLQNFHNQQQNVQNQSKNKGQGQIYNTHDGRQKQQKFDESNPQHYSQLRTANNMNIQSSQIKQINNQGSFKVASGNNGMHQASSLASNHASKVSQISKTYHANPNQQVNMHDKQQQMIMQLRQNKGQNNQTDKAYYQAQRGNGHVRGNSDDLQFNTMAMQNEMNNQGGTMIHTNHLSSLVHSNQNNTFVNTALGSSRGKPNAVDQGTNVKMSLNNRNSKKQVNSNHQNNIQVKMNKTGMSVGQNQFKQTAQFGPQMNLIKSQLPHQSNNSTMNQKQAQQKQIKSVEMRSKQYLSSMSGGTSTMNQNQQQQILTSNSTNSNQQRAMMMQNNGMQPNDKRQQNIKSKMVNTSMNQKALRQQSFKSTGIPQNSIYQTQQNQRKSKLISTGGNMMGYDMSKGNGSGQVQSSQSNNQANYFQNQNSSSHYNTQNTGQTQNSIGRSEKQGHMISQNSQINSIPNTNSIQLASKQFSDQNYTHQTNSTGGSIPPTKTMGPSLKQQNLSSQIQGQHIQSYSFDFRSSQQNKQMQQNQQRMNNQGMVGGNMRTFDGQYQQKPHQTTNTSQSPPNLHMMQNRVGTNMGQQKPQAPNSGTQQKTKSSSLGQPKEGVQSNNQQNRFQDDYDYSKGMNKKVKQSQNNHLYGNKIQNESSQKVNKIKENEQMNIRSSYNSTGPNVKKDQNKYSAQGGGFINMNQNMNAFENQMQDQINTTDIAQKNKGIKQQNSKRVTAVTRGVQSGTNARVNTFDNRGMQNQNQQQYHQGQAPHSVMSANNPKIYDLQQQQMRQTNHNGQSDKQQQQHLKNRASYSGSQQQYNHHQQQQTINNYQQPQKPQGGKHSGLNSASQQKSPKRNIYLLNYQGNVQII